MVSRRDEGAMYLGAQVESLEDEQKESRVAIAKKEEEVAALLHELASYRAVIKQRDDLASSLVSSPRKPAGCTASAQCHAIKRILSLRMCSACDLCAFKAQHMTSVQRLPACLT